MPKKTYKPEEIVEEHGRRDRDKQGGGKVEGIEHHEDGYSGKGDRPHHGGPQCEFPIEALRLER